MRRLIAALILAVLTLSAAGAAPSHQAQRAALPAADRKAMIAAEIMRRIYEKLLHKMEHDKFRVFTRRYRLSRWEKLRCIVAARFSRASSRDSASPTTGPGSTIWRSCVAPGCRVCWWRGRI